MNSTTSHKSLYFKTHSKLKKKKKSSLQKVLSETFFSPPVIADGEDAKQMLTRYGPAGLSWPERPVVDSGRECCVSRTLVTSVAILRGREGSLLWRLVLKP